MAMARLYWCHLLWLLVARGAGAERPAGWRGAAPEEAPREVADGGLSMVQMVAAQRYERKNQVGRKPWEMSRFTAVAYHKTGVFLLQELQHLIFGQLGAPDSAIGVQQLPCFNKLIPNDLYCRNTDAPIRTLVDMYGPEVEQRERLAAGPGGMRVAGSVRDPLGMAASAYCYHHRGEELGYMPFWPPGILVTMGMEDGMKFVAERLLPTVRNMTAIFEQPAKDTLRLSFENFSASSAGFDHELQRLVTFWLGDFISPAEQQSVLESARKADLSRNRADIQSASSDLAAHSNDKDCEQQARRAAASLPPALLDEYRSLQRRLGYPTGG